MYQCQLVDFSVNAENSIRTSRTHHTCLDQQFASFQFRRQKLNILDGIAIDNS
jgi:hypothetical protein